MIGTIATIQKKGKILKKPKLGFLIETKLNRDILRRILEEYFINVDYILASAVNHASLYGSFPDVLEYHQQGYEHVFHMFETNTFEEAIIQQQINYFNEDVRNYRLEDYVTFIPIRPHFQAWIRPKMEKYIEDTHDFMLFGDDPADIEIDVEQMKREVPDFQKFVELVEGFSK